jgi:hypothetical protein
MLWRGAHEKRGASMGTRAFKEQKRRDGGDWNASVEKKVISSNKSEAYNAVVRDPIIIH